MAVGTALTDRIADRIAQDYVAAAPLLSARVVSRERRKSAVDTLAEQGLPGARDENWKYANLRPLERARFAPSSPRARPDISVADLPPPIEGYVRYTFADGAFVPELSKPMRHAGVSVVTLRGEPPAARQSSTESRSGDLATRSSLPDARFALLNDMFATDGASLRVAEGVDCSACVEIVFVASEASQTAASYPRLDLFVEPNARVGLIERHVSLHSDANFVNGAVHIEIGRNAHVEHHRLQQVGARATWIDTLSASVARSTMHVQLAGERAELALHAVSLADQHQVHDAFALVEHIAAHSRSEQSVRGIAAGRARVAFNSKVVVREGARGADSRQSLRGLLAGPEAEIDVRPQLEIYTDDVKCSHGATAGKLDDNMLFYLLSRGLEPDTAQRLLKWAFLEDVVAKIRVPELRRYIEQSLAGHLKETLVLKELL
jgi:Fe-S cluster assembly protein SufD